MQILTCEKIFIFDVSRNQIIYNFKISDYFRTRSINQKILKSNVFQEQDQ